MPTETVYGLAADATSDTAVAGIFAAKGRPAFNPLISHVLDVGAARLEGEFSPEAEKLARSFLARPAHAGPAGRAGMPREPACARGSRHARASRSRARHGARADRGGGDAACGPFGQPLGPRQSDDRRACFRRSRRQDRLDPRRRPGAPRARIDDRGVSRCDADAAAARRDRARGYRGRASDAARPRGRLRNGADRPGASRIALRAARPRPARRPGRAGKTRPRSILPARSAGGAPVARLDLSPSGDLVEAAANLFAYLRALDETGAPCIAVAHVPHRGLGAAINDRLKRAAAAREA